MERVDSLRKLNALFLLALATGLFVALLLVFPVPVLSALGSCVFAGVAVDLFCGSQSERR